MDLSWGGCLPLTSDGKRVAFQREVVFTAMGEGGKDYQNKNNGRRGRVFLLEGLRSTLNSFFETH